MARITDVSQYLGPSLYASLPVVRATLAWDSPGGRYVKVPPTAAVSALEQVLPGLSIPEPVSEGFDTAALILAVAVRIQFLSDADTEYHAVVEDGSGVHLICSYENQNVHTYAIRMAVDLVNQFLSSAREEDKDIEEARASCQAFYQQARPANWTMDYRLIVHGARKRGVPVQHLMHYCIMLGQGRGRRLMLGKHTDRTGYLANRIANDKSLANQMLKQVGLPMPAQRVVNTDQEAVDAARAIGHPVAVKPLSGGGGEGVTADVRDDAAVIRAFRRARGNGASPVVVESMLAGEQHRFTLIDGELVALYRQAKATVVGDGKHTVAELVEIENRDPRRSRGESGDLRPMLLDEEALDTLRNAGYEPASVPAAGEKVMVASKSNAHAGGTYERLLGQTPVHPDNLSAAVLAADTVGLDIAGVDFIIPDVTRSWKEQAGGICEINESPGLWDSPAAEAKLFEYLFPPESKPRVPLASVMGRAGRVVASMLAHVMRTAGSRVGLAGTDCCRVGDDILEARNSADATHVQQLFRHPWLESAVVQTVRGSVLAEGLGFDRCDVAAVLDVSEERSGPEGIGWAGVGDLESLLLEHAGETVVLNGDDALCAALAKPNDAARVWLVSSDPDGTAVAAHVAAGGKAVTLERDGSETWIVIHEGERPERFQCSAQLPFADEETLRPSLFVIAMARGLGVEKETIASALQAWQPDSVSSSSGVLSF